MTNQDRSINGALARINAQIAHTQAGGNIFANVDKVPCPMCGRDLVWGNVTGCWFHWADGSDVCAEDDRYITPQQAIVYDTFPPVDDLEPWGDLVDAARDWLEDHRNPTDDLEVPPYGF